jgi:hypothetical protein
MAHEYYTHPFVKAEANAAYAALQPSLIRHSLIFDRDIKVGPDYDHRSFRKSDSINSWDNAE